MISVNNNANDFVKTSIKTPFCFLKRKHRFIILLSYKPKCIFFCHPLYTVLFRQYTTLSLSPTSCVRLIPLRLTLTLLRLLLPVFGKAVRTCKALFGMWSGGSGRQNLPPNSGLVEFTSCCCRPEALFLISH